MSSLRYDNRSSVMCVMFLASATAARSTRASVFSGVLTKPLIVPKGNMAVNELFRFGMK